MNTEGNENFIAVCQRNQLVNCDISCSSHFVTLLPEELQFRFTLPCEGPHSLAVEQSISI